MKIQLSSFDVVTTQTDCLIVGIREKADQPASVRKIEKATGGLIRELMNSKDISGKAGSSLLVPAPQIGRAHV